MVKICFICETPLHILNCMNYIANQDEFCDPEIDIYVGRKFSGSEELAQRLRKTEMVHRVYTYLFDMNRASVFEKATAIVSPRKFIANGIDGAFDPRCLDYDYVNFAFFGPMPYAMVYANKRAKVRYFEDGLGTYVGTSATADFSLLRKALYLLTGTDYTRLFKPEALFVNNKAMCKSSVTSDIRQLMPLADADESFLEKLFYVFAYKPNPIYAERKCVYLSRANDSCKPEIDAMDRMVEEALAAFSDKFVLRMHPRQKDFRVGRMLPDTARTSWELICVNEITEDHILVGWFSTAQVIPKFILDKEPWLVFYYPIYQRNSETADVVYESFDRMITELKTSYRNPEKVVMIDSVEGIPAALEAIVRGE